MLQINTLSKNIEQRNRNVWIKYFYMRKTKQSCLSFFVRQSLFEHAVHAVQKECRIGFDLAQFDKSAPPSCLHFPLFPSVSLPFSTFPFLFEQDVEFAAFPFDIRSPAIRDFTSCFKSRDAAISRPTMPIPPFFFSSFLSFFFPFFPCPFACTDRSCVHHEWRV